MEPPPQQFVPYPRGGNYGSVDALRQLGAAYFGVYWLVAGTMFLGFGTQGASTVVALAAHNESDPTALGVSLGGYGLMFIVNFCIAYKYASLVASATNRSTGYAIMLSFFAMLFSPCCFGLLGCAVVQQAVANELKKYDLKVGFLGLKKSQIEEKIALMESDQGKPLF